MPQREMSGILSKNDYKKEERHPDYRGEAMLDGIEYKISGWKKKRHSDGGTFLSLSFTRKEDQEGSSTSQPQQQTIPIDGEDEDAPF